jgi:phosphatidylserine decarboxylase
MTIVQKLRDHLEQHPKLKQAFEESFKTASKLNIPQFTEYNIRTPADYLDFYEKLLRWTPSETSSGKNVYNHICMFYFVLDQEPMKKYQVREVPNPTPAKTWLSDWIVKYCQEFGRFMDSPESINEETLKTFYASKAYHMDDYPVVLGGWRTFNEFFARHIHAHRRPIASPEDPAVIVSPADATFDGCWPVDQNGIFTSKGLPWSIIDLLQDSEYGEKFSGGQFMHAFLNTTDYHRQHAPVAGIVKEAKVIPGLCYLKVDAKQDDNGNHQLCARRHFEAVDGAGYQFLQARGLVIIDNPEIGLVAILPVGMSHVSSVRLSVKPGDVVKKGSEIAYFQFGGSDVVMVFQAASQVKILAQEGIHYNVGTHIATAKPLPKQRRFYGWPNLSSLY